jgi:homogentisate 1,2-dioxygenase
MSFENINFFKVSPDNQWDDVQGHFMDHLDEINEDLKAAGFPILGRGSV